MADIATSETAAPDPPTEPGTRRTPATVAVAMLRALRPKQWVKNVLLLAAIVFSMSFTSGAAWLRVGLGFAAFSLVSSSGYILNDARDREADRKHPRKRKRPIASGSNTYCRFQRDAGYSYVLLAGLSPLMAVRENEAAS